MFSWEIQCGLCGVVKPYFYFCKKQHWLGTPTVDKFKDQCRACADPQYHDNNDEQRAMGLFRKSPLWEVCLDYWGHRCAVCERPKADGLLLAIDHWLPYTNGNELSILNVIPLCQGKHGCNNTKTTRAPYAWLVASLGSDAGQEKHAEIDQYFAWVLEREANGYFRRLLKA